jgi:hypothetical protein
MSRHVVIPLGSWPARMTAELAAGYVGERSVEQFLRRVGREYPKPAIDEGVGRGRRRLWLKTSLDKAIHPEGGGDDDPPEIV